MSDCIFCKIVKGEITSYKIYEDELFFGFLDIYPRVKGHTLLIPKRHYRWVYDVPDFGGYWERAKIISDAMQKALKPEFVSNPTIVANFIDEAKLTRDMKEDHIMSVQYVDVERSQDLEYPYIIMEYIKGGTLREKLDSGEQIDLVKCTEIMNDMCLALSYAHQNNFAHFDIKPSNIFYDNEKKRWKLGDFGLAKAVNIGGSMTPRGSLPYMAPEMREGKGSSKSDVYSLGKVFMEILTGDLNGELGQLEKIHGTEYHDELEQYTSLIDEMLNANPAKRPSIRDVMKIFSVSKTRTNQPKRKGR